MPQVLEKLPVARPRVPASRRLEFRSGDAQVHAAHGLLDGGAVDTAVSHIADRRCYVCRKPVPTSRERIRAGRWSDIRIGGITIATLCADCSPKPRGQSLDVPESLTVADE